MPRGGAEEGEALRGDSEPSETRQRYTVTLICEALRSPRSSVYAAAALRGRDVLRIWASHEIRR